MKMIKAIACIEKPFKKEESIQQTNLSYLINQKKENDS
jgi:hypothetical protein